MIQCPKCDNDTRTSALVTGHGEVLLAGTLSAEPQPIVAQVCTACGYIELYAPQPINAPENVAAQQVLLEPQAAGELAPAAS